MEKKEAEYRFLIQCKMKECIFNKPMYVAITDTIQLCCGKKVSIIRLDKNGKCAVITT